MLKELLAEEPAGAKDDSRDAPVLGDALRTDARCFRRLAPVDPVVIELREFSRIAEDLRQERTRLGNRVREQLWRYYPQILDIADDVAADWFLELGALVPSPDKARRVREATLAKLLKRHRICRFDAAVLPKRWVVEQTLAWLSRTIVASPKTSRPTSKMPPPTSRSP